MYIAQNIMLRRKKKTGENDHTLDPYVCLFQIGQQEKKEGAEIV